MSAEETASAIGEPLFRSAGRVLSYGFMIITPKFYFFGSLVGWTTPATEKAAGQAVDVWQGNQGGATAPTFLFAIPAWYPAKGCSRGRSVQAATTAFLPIDSATRRNVRWWCEVEPGPLRDFPRRSVRASRGRDNFNGDAREHLVA